MKSLPADKSKKDFFDPSPAAGEIFEPEIFADSLEVMEAYCIGKIASLEYTLNNLTIEDHTKEIISLCQEIKKQRKVLMQIIVKKRRD